MKTLLLKTRSREEFVVTRGFLNPGTAGFGGLLRDSDGIFSCGFYGSFGRSNIAHA